MTERLMTLSELSAELGVSYAAVSWRLKRMGVAPCGSRDGMKVFAVDPADVLTRSARKYREGWKPTSYFTKLLKHSEYKVAPFLRDIGAEEDGGGRDVVFWLLPEKLRDDADVARMYGLWEKAREEARARWEAKINAEEHVEDWLSTCEPDVRAMVMSERENKRRIGTEVEAETAGGRLVRGTLLECSMNSVTIRVGGSVRFFLARELTIHQ